MAIESLQPISSGSRSKLPLVVEELCRLAERLGIGAKLPTTRELSAALGVTGVTLSRALAQLESRGVLMCRQGSGIYVGAGMGQKHVGLIFGGNIFSGDPSPFGTLVLQHSAKRADFLNERFSFYIDYPALHGTMNGVEVPGHQDLADALKERKLDGLMLVSRSSLEQETWLRGFGLPVVSAETSPDAVVPGRDVVLFDYEALIRQGVRRLKKSGCPTVGLIGAKHEHQEMFRRALAETELPAALDGWAVSPGKSSLGHPEEYETMWRRLAKTWCPSGASPEGLLLTDDTMARSILPILAQRGLLTGPNAITVCSHTNAGSHALNEWNSRILTVKFNPGDMVVALFDMLGALMNGQEVSSPRLVPPTGD